MLKTIFRPFAIAIVCLVNVVTLALTPPAPPPPWPLVALIVVAEVFLIGCALALADRLTRPTPSTPDAPVGYRENAQVSDGGGLWTAEDDALLSAAKQVGELPLAAASIATTTVNCGDPTCSGIPRPRAPHPGPAPRPISE